MWSDSLLTLKAKSRDRHDFTSQTTEASVASDTWQRFTTASDGIFNNQYYKHTRVNSLWILHIYSVAQKFSWNSFLLEMKEIEFGWKEFI